MFSVVIDLATPFAAGIGLEGVYSLGEYFRKRDIVAYFKRFKTRHSSDQALHDLKKIKAGLEKYNMKKSWPFGLKFTRMPDEDLEVLNSTIDRAIDEAEKSDDLSAIKQKMAVMETNFEDVICKNYKYNPYQLGFLFHLFSRLFLIYGFGRLAFTFYFELSTLFHF